MSLDAYQQLVGWFAIWCVLVIVVTLIALGLAGFNDLDETAKSKGHAVGDIRGWQR